MLYACMTCNPPASDSTTDDYTPAAVCYSCSVQCHGEHVLVELFNKRNFVCDCGTTRMPTTSPCNLRINPTTNQKGGVVSEPAAAGNTYNHNFQNRFCGCDCDYDAHQQKGTMFQCLGLATVKGGGCGEDWWHPGCVVGLGPTWFENEEICKHHRKRKVARGLETITEDPITEPVDESGQERAIDSAEESDDDIPTPPGFPDEDDFDGFICYKCVDAFPWIKRYAGSDGFLAPVFKRSAAPSPESRLDMTNDKASEDERLVIPMVSTISTQIPDNESSVAASEGDEHANYDITESNSKKRKVDDIDSGSNPTKRIREGSSDQVYNDGCKLSKLPPAAEGTLSLFFKSDFRDHLCRCPDCFPNLAKHPQLLEEEETYEPPVSEDGEEGSTVGSGSLLDRGERALTNMDRVRAIEGVMAYNHLKEKLTPFFKEFAESGRAISADDIKAHFAKLRGDEEAIRQAGEAAAHDADNRREQSGY